MDSCRVKRYLDDNDVHYVIIYHPPAATAQQTAAAIHRSGHAVAKTLIVQLDGSPAMVVVPASRRISLDALATATGASEAVLADETDFCDRFPDCETGTMPPFGNLYGMNTYIARPAIENDSFTFMAGTHQQVISMGYEDFLRLAHPTLLPDDVIA
jgi:Ala-tRNA(Pro) deacylase